MKFQVMEVYMCEQGYLVASIYNNEEKRDTGIYPFFYDGSWYIGDLGHPIVIDYVIEQLEQKRKELLGANLFKKHYFRSFTIDYLILIAIVFILFIPFRW